LAKKADSFGFAPHEFTKYDKPQQLARNRSAYVRRSGVSRKAAKPQRAPPGSVLFCLIVVQSLPPEGCARGRAKLN
jgi:hypothetical protein